MVFKELAYANTSLGELSLRLRTELKLDKEVYEIKLNEEYLMSSLFTAAEEELARIGLRGIDLPELDVVVGGLGLGYTAKTALENKNVKSLVVVDLMAEVIQWHREKILPLGEILTADNRCRIVHGDFFSMAEGKGFDPDHPNRRFHAILLDIDHTPDFTLHDSHKSFYSREGLTRLLDFLHPGGIFALWSNDPPDPDFISILQSVFSHVEGHVVEFPNPLRDCKESNTIYRAEI